MGVVVKELISASCWVEASAYMLGGRLDVGNVHASGIKGHIKMNVCFV